MKATKSVRALISESVAEIEFLSSAVQIVALFIQQRNKYKCSSSKTLLLLQSRCDCVEINANCRL